MAARVFPRPLALLTLVGATSCVPPPALEEDLLPTLAADTEVGLHDVAVVWPLPPGTGPDSGVGFLGSPISCDDLAIFEPLTRTDEPATICASLTVTAARLDPCFREGGPDTECQPQLRLVLQPVIEGRARDASIHVFAHLAEKPLARAVARLIEARDVDAGGGRLGVHPLLADPETRVAVADILADAIDAATIDHFTQITVHGDEAAWTFELRAFVDGHPEPGEAIQQHVLSISPSTIDVSVTPVGASPDAFDVLLRDEDARAASLEAQQAAYDAAARVEHPDLHDPGTIDCARCHLATPARAAAAARSNLADSPDAFSSERHDLRPTDVFGNPQFIHALAWRGEDLAINARAVHESARSADLLQTLLVDLGVIP